MLKNIKSDAGTPLFRMTFSSKAFSSERSKTHLIPEYITKILSPENSEKAAGKIFIRIFDIISDIGTEEDEIIFTASENEKKELLLKLEIPSSHETKGRCMKSDLENFTTVEEDKDSNKITITIPASGII
ncbi:MAG: hypothetical protein A2017_05740 [Lentisphaerae bacterium GWF2_44_16]|nr:MAG: hypothetical protein A2017_05740 [Lentisphaerae bacterium GWF2_44_16]